MKIIAFEGLDKSGKNSASTYLASRFENAGFKVVQSEFHRYDTPTGKLIWDYLHGDYKVSNETIQLIMAADKFAQQEWFSELEEQGVDVLILDRYTLSQKVYATYFNLIKNNIPVELYDEYTLGKYNWDLTMFLKDEQWIESLISKVRKPDLTVYLDVSAEVSMNRKGQHGDNDLYESNKELLSTVRKIYIHNLSSDKSIKSITLNGEQTKEEVNAEMLLSFCDENNVLRTDF